MNKRLLICMDLGILHELPATMHCLKESLLGAHIHKMPGSIHMSSCTPCMHALSTVRNAAIVFRMLSACLRELH